MPIKTATLKPLPPTEKEIQAAIMNRLQLNKWLVVRINSSVFTNQKGHFYRGYVIQGLNASAGFPDVMAFKGNRFLLIEVKDKGGKLTPSQQRFHQFAERFGITIHVLRSVDELEAIGA